MEKNRAILSVYGYCCKKDLLTPTIAWFFKSRFGICCAKNIRKCVHLTALFALHLLFLLQKAAVQVAISRL